MAHNDEIEELEEMEDAGTHLSAPAPQAAPAPSGRPPPRPAAPPPQAVATAQTVGAPRTAPAPQAAATAQAVATPRPAQPQMAGAPAICGIYQNCLFSVLIINANFQIVYSNPQARNFFGSYLTLGNCAFFDLFGKYFTFEDVRGIRAAVLNGGGGYCWRGKAEIKSRNHPKLFTRVYIFPASTSPQARPTLWTVLFDDVTEESRALLRSVFISLLEASKLKDNDTGKHITRVNFYSEALARKLFNRSSYPEVDAEFIDNIGFLAAMHDVGKIGTPDDVLNKQGPLSDWEWNVMKEHTKNGAFILSTYPNPMAKEIAQSHHEKWNGKGYPFGIDGKNIPLSARIVSIADVYDALRMRRSYKPSFTHEVTMEKIMEGKGTQFDPALMDIFAEIALQFNEIYEQNKDTDGL